MKLLSIFRVYVYLSEVTSGSHSWNSVFSCAPPLALSIKTKTNKHNNNNKETHQLNNLRVNEHRVHKKKIDKREIHRFVVQHQPYILWNFAQNSDYCSHCYMISLCIVVPGRNGSATTHTILFISLSIHIQWLWTSFCVFSSCSSSCRVLMKVDRIAVWKHEFNSITKTYPKVESNLFFRVFFLLYRTINANG